ncbi:MAG TPA: hypothetical protein PK323_07900 [Bacteroidia bacterium]|nr:hypothetical protein [Bacteroidia bacterium]
MNEVLKQIQSISQLQITESKYFTKGLFETKRVWARGLYQRKDNTGFFAASIGFTLLRYHSLYTKEEYELVNKILKNIEKALPSFRNKDGHASYNFWQTKPSKHFPGGYFAHMFKFFMIPDDIDDSSIIHLVLKHSNEEQMSLKIKMGQYAIGNLKWPDRPVKGYEKFKTYNTFFVKNMPAAFDICALCNTLYFVYKYQLPLNEQDHDSIKLVETCLENDDHINRPFQLSPYYPNTVLIIYHIVRLITDFNILGQFKNKLIAQASSLITKANGNEIEKLMLTICLQKLQEIPIYLNEPKVNDKATFPFFVAGILGEVSSKWLRSLSFLNITHIKYQSLAFAETLWLEHLILNRFFNKN